MAKKAPPKNEPKQILPDEVRAYIVQALACYDTPSTVAEAVRTEFGLTVARQIIEGYNPTKFAGRKLSEKWKVVFESTRKAFKEATSEVPIANKAVRLRALNRMAEKAESMKNMALAAQLLEQAAKEVGDVYTNKQKIDANVKATAHAVIVPAKDVA